MKAANKMCFDRVLPRDMNKPQRTMMVGTSDRAVSLMGKQWPNESTISIRFLGGTEAQRELVRSTAPKWTEHANLNFEFSDDPRAKIRVSFDEDDGAWSYVGTDNLDIPLHAATLNLGWVDEGVILHEFGHMIGFSHEHQNPAGGIEWNEAAVIADLSGAPNFWDPATIRHNVLNKYRADQVHGTDFDPRSIMLYAFPANWTLSGQGTDKNDELSAQDKAFAASAVMYPGRGSGDGTGTTPLTVLQGVTAEISAAGEEDSYSFDVGQAGTHTIETSCTTDLVLSLFGPDDKTTKVAEDDDGGSGRNSRIVAELQPGHYLAIIRHYSNQSTGSYRVMVTRD